MFNNRQLNPGNLPGYGYSRPTSSAAMRNNNQQQQQQRAPQLAGGIGYQRRDGYEPNTQPRAGPNHGRRVPPGGGGPNGSGGNGNRGQRRPHQGGRGPPQPLHRQRYDFNNIPLGGPPRIGAGFTGRTTEEVQRQMREAAEQQELERRRLAEMVRQEERRLAEEDNCSAAIMRTTCDSDYDSENDGDFMAWIPADGADDQPNPNPVRSQRPTTSAGYVAEGQQRGAFSIGRNPQALKKALADAAAGRAPINRSKSPPMEKRHRDSSYLSSPDDDSDASSEQSRKRHKKSKKHKKDKKEKKRKEKALRQDDFFSDASAGEATMMDHDGSADDKEERKKRKKEKKRREKEREEAEYGAGVGVEKKELTMKEIRKRAKKIIKPASQNSWALLRGPTQLEYNDDMALYDTGHERGNYRNMVMDPRWVPEYTRVSYGALSQSMSQTETEVLMKYPVSATRLPWRYFNAVNETEWREGTDGAPVERQFQKVTIEEAEKELAEGFVPISTEPMDQTVDVAEICRQRRIELHNIRVEDFARLAKLPQMRWEEADLAQKEEILRAQLVLRPRDVKKWIDLTRLQRPIFQLNENGDPNIVTRDLRGLYLKKEAILKGMEGSSINADRYNPNCVELSAELIRAEEERYWPDESVEDRRIRWAEQFRRKYPNRIEMWRLLIQRWQRDPDGYTLADTLATIDNALATLDLVNKGRKIGRDEAGGDSAGGKKTTVEPFIADLLVHRFKSQWVAGAKAAAIKMLQSMTEYWFFLPPDAVSHARLEMLSAFWTSGAARIGEPWAQGWCNTPIDTKLADRREFLHELKTKVVTEKNTRVNAAIAKYAGSNEMDLWREMESAWEHVSWNPLHWVRGDDSEREYTAYMTEWNKPGLLFHFRHDFNLAEQIILRILHYLGAVIPGMADEHDSESVLHRLAPELFPVATEEEHLGMGEFLVNFLKLLAQSSRTDVLDLTRINAAIVLTWSKFNFRRSDISDAEKMELSRRLYSMIADLSGGDGFISAVLFYYVIEQFHSSGLHHLQLDAMSQTLTTLRRRLPEDVDLWSDKLSAERPYYLKLVQFFLHRLPFTEDKSKLQMPDLEWTRLELLTRLAIHGNLAGPHLIYSGIEPADLRTVLKRAGEIWRQLIDVNDSAHKERVWRSLDGENNDMPWFANPYPIMLDMAALFFHEMSKLYFQHPDLDSDKVEDFKWEITADDENRRGSTGPVYAEAYRKILIGSPLGKLMSAHPGGHVEPIEITAEEFCAASSNRSLILRKLLTDAVKMFPRSVSLMKKLLEVSTIPRAREFLHAYPGEEDRVRLIRRCALICVETRAIQELTSVSDQLPAFYLSSTLFHDHRVGEYGEKPWARVQRYRRALEAAARAEYEDWGMEVNEAHMWCLWMKEEQRLFDEGAYGIDKERINMILDAGKERCPYSKQLLLNASHNRVSRAIDEKEEFMKLVGEANDSGRVMLLASLSEVAALMEQGNMGE